MKPHISQNTWKNICKAFILIGLAVACVQFFPKQTNNFKYFYETGKPWGYELLTAEKDFPIYKSEKQLQQEQEEVLRQYTPYFNINTAIGETQKEQILGLQQITYKSQAVNNYLAKQLDLLYEQGIFSSADYEKLQKEGYTRVTIVNAQRVATTLPLTAFHTPRTAYSTIVENAPEQSKSSLRELGLNQYIIPNLTYDTAMSEQIHKSLLESVSLTEGMVQSGARIIDRGDIVTETHYQILNSLKIAYDETGGDNQSVITQAGDIALLCIFLVLLIVYLIMFRRNIFDDLRSLLFFSLLIVLTVGLSCITLRYTKFSIYLIPFAWIPIMVCVFYDSRTAFVMHIITILIVSIVVPAPFDFLVIQLTAGMVTVSSMKDITQRAQLAQTAAWIFLAHVLSYTAFTLAITGDFSRLNWQIYVYFLVNSLLVIFAYGFIYLCEKSFGFVSSITLVELTNVNSRLLLAFAEKAPGTFQHSLQVSNLATEAARKIGANTLLVRTGALYHDIGKMTHPQYFTENQTGGVNPLYSMPHDKAAQIIIAHVADGIRIARKNNLPAMITRFIETHHSTSKARYFYNSYVNEHPSEQINEALFTYPGPRPTTKEGGILMMADAVEARSRSLSIYTPESISDMVEQMINAQIAEGQLRDTPLSFKDVEDIKDVFKEKLTNIYHHRIAYPELKETHK